MRARVCRGLIAIVTGLLGVAIPVALASGWSPSPVYLSTDSSTPSSEAPTIAVSPNGDIAALWLETSGASTLGSATLNARVDNGSGFGAVSSLGSADPLAALNHDYPQVAVDSSGDATAVWTDNGALMAATKSSLSSSFTALPTPVDSPSGPASDGSPLVGMDAAGDAVAVWEQFDGAGSGAIFYALKPAGAPGFAQPVELTQSLTQNPAAQLAVNAAGQAVIVYLNSPGNIFYSYSASIAKSNSFSAPALGQNDAAFIVSDPVVAISGNGDAAVAWRAQEEVGAFVRGGDLPASVAQSGGGFQGVDSVPGLFPVGPQTYPSIAMESGSAADDTTAIALFDKTNGNVVAFSRPSADYTKGWSALLSGPAGTPPLNVVTEPSADPYPPQLAISSAAATQGQVTMLWTDASSVKAITSDSSGSFTGSTVQALESGSVADQTCANGAAGANNACAQLASSSSGELAAIWQQLDSNLNPQVVASCLNAPFRTHTTGTVTVTATPSASGCDAQMQTSTSAATSNPTAATTTATTKTAAPALARLINVTHTSGGALVQLPSSSSFVALNTLTQIPNGAIIDARHGRVTLTFALPGGGTETATFWGGEFKVEQSRNGAVRATLRGGSFRSCPRFGPPKIHVDHQTRTLTRKPTAGAARSRRPAKPRKRRPGSKVRSLWVNAKGNFTTKGSGGAAAVLGTTWLTRDQCDGTYFFVERTRDDPRGAIRVTVYHPHRHTVLLRRGHHLLAPARGY